MLTENSASTKPKIRLIPAKPRQELTGRTTATGEMAKLRIAPYARVSTDHEEQESSYEAQVKHFKQLIESHDDWELVDIYADPGISGKNIKRPNFQRLIDDCDRGKVDMIITKSVSRFARNTLDCVKTVRKLKEMGIKVYFEKENLDTLQESSEFVLTIMASLAEEESRSISNNIRWSVKKRFENGEVIMSTAHFLGYTKTKNGPLTIVPEQAIIVRRIYGEFLDGYSLQEIADGLMRDGIPSPSGKERWHPTTIKSILQNEKYICKRHENTGKENCGAKPIREDAIEKAFVRALNGLIENREEILDELQKAVVTQVSDSCESEVAQIDEEIRNTQNKIVDLLMDKNGGLITDKQYERQVQLLKFQIDELNLKKEIMLNEQGKVQLAEYRADAVTELLKTGKILDEFDKTIFKSLVRKIKVVADKEIEIEFECGIKVTEKL